MQTRKLRLRDKAASIPLMKGSGPSLEAGGSWLLSGGRAHLRAPPGGAASEPERGASGSVQAEAPGPRAFRGGSIRPAEKPLGATYPCRACSVTFRSFLNLVFVVLEICTFRMTLNFKSNDASACTCFDRFWDK